MGMVILLTIGCGTPATDALDEAPVPVTSPLVVTSPTSSSSAGRELLTPTTLSSPTPIVSLFPIKVTDGNGKVVIFDEPPKRIIAFDSAAVEILFKIDEGNRVVGTHSFVTYPSETKDIAKVGDAFSMDFENVIKLDPDLVFVFYDRFLADLEKLGLKVLYINTLDRNLQDVIAHYRLWGRITGNIETAEREVADIEARLISLEKRLGTVEQGHRVYHHIIGFWTPGADTLIGRLYDLVKAENIAKGISGYAQISPEEIVEADPEVVFLTEDSLAEIQENPAFKDVTAVKNKRIVVLPQGFLAVPGPRLIGQLEELARMLYLEISEE